MISRKTLHELFAHNDWARDKLLAAAAGLPDDALDRPFEMGPGSLRRTLHHLWGAERIWLNRWLGIDRARHAALLDDPGMSLDKLHAAFRDTAAERGAFFAGLTDADLARGVTFARSPGETYTFPLADLMLHVCNHGVHHRAQAVNMLRRLGAELPKPGLDYIFMRLERAAEPPPALDVASVRAFYAYADWARDRVHAAAAMLSDAQLDRPFELGPGTLRATLAHIRFAEEWWYENWTRGPGRPFPETDPQIRIADLDRLFAETAARRTALLDTLDDAGLQRIVRGQPRPNVTREFPLGVTMVQLCCHGTHHRAQALNMLRHVGGDVPAVDYAAMLRDRRGPAPAARG